MPYLSCRSRLSEFGDPLRLEQREGRFDNGFDADEARDVVLSGLCCESFHFKDLLEQRVAL